MREEWEGRYHRGETGWDRGGPSPALVDFIRVAGDARRVLVPGCGRGHEVVALAGRGLDVTAVDIARPAVQALEARLAERGRRARVTCADLFAWEPDAPFDAIYEQTCLCAIPPERRADYEARLYRWLKPGGLLFALFMQTGLTGGPPFHCDLLDMRGLFADARWDWPADAPELVPHRNGRFELAYALRRKP